MNKASMINPMKEIIKIALFLIMSLAMVYAQEYNIQIPEISGIKVEVEKSVTIPCSEKVRTAFTFRFNDGRIVTGSKDNTLWSGDGGDTWRRGPDNRMNEVILDLGNGEILAVDRNTHRRPDGKFKIRLLRSKDNLQTVKEEEGILDLPGASFTVTGSGNRVDGFLFHHGILQLDNGDLIASMYGNYEGDTELCAGYPAELNQRKYHTIVVFSKDRGRTWGNPVHVAYNRMLGRGVPDNHEMIGNSIPASMVTRTAVVPAVTQEGFRESDLIKAPNSDLLCIMRSGGRNPIAGVPLFPTPLYCSRSVDNGQTWTPPMQIADRGTSPNAVVLDNGIIVCTYTRPGNWLIFSDDNGQSWKGAFQFGAGNATNYIIEAGPDAIQVFYEIEENNQTKLMATFFTVKRHQQN